MEEILTKDDYKYLYGRLNIDKIPKHIYEKISCGDDFTREEEMEIKEIIKQDIKERRI